MPEGVVKNSKPNPKPNLTLFFKVQFLVWPRSFQHPSYISGDPLLYIYNPIYLLQKYSNKTISDHDQR